MADFIRYAGWFAAAVVAVYILVRVGSFAYFRTKLEHFRQTMRELNKGD